jgi:hypothetical protein
MKLLIPPQFIQTLSDKGGNFKATLQRAMAAHNQIHINKVKENNFDPLLRDAMDRIQRERKRVLYKGE